ncbi:DUF1766-domain-containing protein [Lojkania enalia]|uniref:DUF1766-domain-containing protein n=1 Tax=Lojkania enalia TaxID=147567 RepID=A0A9P4KD12_9PLEO|nr:DUF1766-domain-containing protein [Didymosphaeria enalia]
MPPFIGHTPESLLPRSDSKNPATTCKGITSSGRPCRRSIANAKNSRNNGVLAVMPVVSEDYKDNKEGLAAFFCWQHKDQAEQLAATNATAPERQDTRIYPLQERSSIDTLVARLGVLGGEDSPQANTQRKKEGQRVKENSSARPPRRVNRPPTWDRVYGPLMSVPSDLITEQKRPSQRPVSSRPQPPKRRSFWALLCCLGPADDDYVEVVRHKKRIEGQVRPTVNPIQAPMSEAPQRISQGHARSSNASPNQLSASRSNNSIPARKPLGEKPSRPINRNSQQPASETLNLLAHIPKSLSPQTTSLLLTELSKPISPHDDEGYIYIFWLTSEAAGPPPSSTASTLLAPPSRPEQGRRTSDVLRQYSVRRPQRPNTSGGKAEQRGTSSPSKDTILLKIGRASNVHRRMNEWTRQCGYSLSLVRFYPYVPSTPLPSPQGSPANSRRPSYQNQRPSDPGRQVSEGVRKVPHVHRVERLIHIELADQRVKKNCEACGKEHREWFEVEAVREEVKAIDEVVRRWVGWAENVSNS